MMPSGGSRQSARGNVIFPSILRLFLRWRGPKSIAKLSKLWVAGRFPLDTYDACFVIECSLYTVINRYMYIGPYVSRSLSSSSASTLVHAFIANRLDYCSSLYCRLPQVRLQPLNGVLRAAARMIGGVPRFAHITDYMRDVLHWLPVQQRILYRISSIVWHCVLGNAPAYLLTLTSACSGRQSLRSASKGDSVVPVVPRARTATRQKRAFSIVGPSVWNGLPSDLRS